MAPGLTWARLQRGFPDRCPLCDSADLATVTFAGPGALVALCVHCCTAMAVEQPTESRTKEAVLLAGQLNYNQR